MMKSEKLRDFKTQEQKIQAVWNTGIYNIGIVTCQVNICTYQCKLQSSRDWTVTCSSQPMSKQRGCLVLREGRENLSSEWIFVFL